MGYRSNLYALVHGSDLIRFNATIAEHELDECFVEQGELDELGYSRFTADGLKWYDGYTDVSAVNAIFEASKHSAMLRIGEEGINDEEIYSGMEDDPAQLFCISYTEHVDF